MQQAGDNVGILLTPAAVIGVKAVDTVEVAAPDREIAGSRALPGVAAQPAQRSERQVQQRRQSVDAAAQPLNHPSVKAPGFRRQSVPQYFGGECRGQENAVAGHEPARRGKPAVGSDEIRPHDAIAVEEDAVDAARRQDRAVANLGGAKSVVLMPDMREPMAEPVHPGLDQSDGGRGRTVIGHDNLEIPVGLAGERAQHRVERILAVIGGDDDGDQLGHGRPYVCWSRL